VTSDDLRLARRVSLAGIATSAALAALNIVAGLYARSTSVLATGVEFAGDVLVSGVVLLGMILATKPADAEHPYGHGRLETLAAFVVGLVLIATGCGIGWHAVQNVGGVHAPPSPAALIVLAVAIAARGLMSGLKFRVARRVHSAALAADAWNDAVDILSALVALAAVGLTIYGGPAFLAADHYGGLAVGAVVVVTGVRVMRDASLELMDTMPDDERIRMVRAVAASVPGVLDVEKTYARKTGFRYHVDLHVGVDPDLTVAESHRIAADVRQHVRAELVWVADVLVHIEPTDSAHGPRAGDGR
jgi:cation diffusion facilitator family transporter